MILPLPLALLVAGAGSGALLEVPAGGDLGAALARAGDGDVIRLAPGVYRASLGRARRGLRVEGAGPEATLVEAPEGEDGLVVEDGAAAALSGLSLRATSGRAAVKVLGGALTLRDVALTGAVGLYAGGGRVEGREVELAGLHYGLLTQRARVDLAGGHARGGRAGVAVVSGEVALARFAVTGPSGEAGLSVSGGGHVRLEGVVVRSPGPSGVAVAGGRVTGAGVVIAGAREEQGVLGDCLHVRKGTLALEGAVLWRCAGAALEASGGELALRGAEATGGAAGCLVLVDGARAELVGNTCVGTGPALVAASGARARARMNRWRTDPVLWVDCGSGARVELGPGERGSEPCRAGR